MKEAYFTIQSLDQQARDLYQQVADISKSNVLDYQPSQSALLVLDMQSYFLDISSHACVPSGGAILAGILQLIDAFYLYQRPIFFTQHANTPENAGMMAVWWKDLITFQNPLAAIVPEIDLSKGILIQKSQYDAFYQTPLEDRLQEIGVTQVVLCGVMTNLCCETTARSAFMRGFKVFFPVDGTAAYTLAYPRASLINLAHGFASLTFISNILDAIRGEYEG